MSKLRPMKNDPMHADPIEQGERSAQEFSDGIKFVAVRVGIAVGIFCLGVLLGYWLFV